jgi:L-alanine-DL-glutamate epimerase-like enolase superfamily enzyme
MKIESIDLFYLSMPEVLDIGDGSQDALLVRIRAGGYEGWGECEASPLTSIASFVAPMSHSACKPVKFSVEGKDLNDVADIYRISKLVYENSFDLLQACHTLSGIDIALWDLLGKAREVPVYSLLGYKRAYAKLPYASQLFGDTPEETFLKAKSAFEKGYKAVKFGWGPFGKGTLNEDVAHLQAAREGLGTTIHLMVDAGTVWHENSSEAAKRLNILRLVNAYWLEEPFVNGALTPYNQLSKAHPGCPLAGGEGCHNYAQAAAMVEFAGLHFIQIDTGRIGGITIAKRVADLARTKGVTYVNHTFTSHLALSASLQPFAGIADDIICEYPIESKQLALDITKEKILTNSNGMIHVPEKPGLGLTVDTEKLKPYLVNVEININGNSIFKTTSF